MDIDNGKVTLHGKVATQAVKDKAELVSWPSKPRIGSPARVVWPR